MCCTLCRLSLFGKMPCIQLEVLGEGGYKASSDQQRASGGQGLLEAAWSRGACGGGLVASITRSFVLVGSHILMRDLNHLDVYWESNTASCKQTRSLLECSENNFLVQILDKLARERALLDLVLISAEELKKLRLEVVWAVVTMPWLSSWFQGVWS